MAANEPTDAGDEARQLGHSLQPGSIGLFQLYPPETPARSSATSFEPQVDVVAVHGLGGHPRETWTSKEDGTLWIRELLPLVNGFQNARILSFGYDASAFLRPFQTATRGNTFQFGESLLSDLADRRVTTAAKARPIIFIGHSLGGIVIKSTLRHARLLETQFGDILDATKGIVFFGTPHQGSDTALFASLLHNLGKYVGLRRTEVLKELERWSVPLTQLSAQFTDLPGRYKINITSFFETKAIYGHIIVPDASARMNIPQERAKGLTADHETICKFSKDDELWSNAVKGRFEAVAVETRIWQEGQAVRDPQGETDDTAEFE